MNTYRMHVQYSSYIDIDAESLDDRRINDVSDYIAESEHTINKMLMPLGFVKCDSAISIEPVEAYLPVEITVEQANEMIEWMSHKVCNKECCQWSYEDLERQGYRIEGRPWQ